MFWWFSVMLVPKLLLTPIKIRFLAQKRPNLVQNLNFWSFWAKYCHFLHILSNDRPKTMWTRCLGEFSVMWATKLLISQVKKRIFCPKTTKFGPKLAFLVNLGQAMQASSVLCWWVGWWLWRAGCISQDTYLLYFTSGRVGYWDVMGPVAREFLMPKITYQFPLFIIDINSYLIFVMFLHNSNLRPRNFTLKNA